MRGSHEIAEVTVRPFGVEIGISVFAQADEPCVCLRDPVFALGAYTVIGAIVRAQPLQLFVIGQTEDAFAVYIDHHLSSCRVHPVDLLRRDEYPFLPVTAVERVVL